MTMLKRVKDLKLGETITNVRGLTPAGEFFAQNKRGGSTAQVIGIGYVLGCDDRITVRVMVGGEVPCEQTLAASEPIEVTGTDTAACFVRQIASATA